MNLMSLMQVRDLEVSFGTTKILRGISLDLIAGETLGVVGESGCGKSMTGLSMMGMLPPGGRVTAGSILLERRELIGLREREWVQLRGKELAMVMQDPFTSLNPMMRVGEQIAEVVRLHLGLGHGAAKVRACEMLERVGFPTPELFARSFPHQLSGGQRQRVVLAIAFACRPKVLIADEPTTALDVTLQAQILRLIRDLQVETGTAVMLISHNIGVIGSLASRIAVFYAGRVVEHGPTDAVLRSPMHPYTRALLGSIPDPSRERLDAIGGQPPNLAKLPEGCSFAPRCPRRFEKCVAEPGLLGPESHKAACWLVEAGVLAD